MITPNNWSRSGEQSGNEALFLEAIHCRWSTAFFRGDIARLLADGREGIQHYDMERHSRLGAEFGGHDPGVCAHVVLGWGLRSLATPGSRGQHRTRRGARRESSKSSSLAFACMNAMTGYEIIGDRVAVLRLAQRMLEIADKFNLPPQRSIAIFMSGWVTACGGNLADGLQIMESEFARVSMMGPLPPFYAGLLAIVRLEPARSRERLSRWT